MRTNVVTAGAMAALLASLVSAQAGTNGVTADFFRATDTGNTNYFLGKTGIGTNNPQERLHVAGNARVDGNLVLTNGALSIWNGLGCQNFGYDPAGAGGWGALYLYSGQFQLVNSSIQTWGTSLPFWNGTAGAGFEFTTSVNPWSYDGPKYMMNSQGLGVGTNNPASMLHVKGNSRMDGSLQLLNGANVNEFSTDGALTDNSDATVPTEKAVKTYVDGKDGSHWAESVASANVRMNGKWLSNDGDNEGMYIATDGKVGIGTSSPASDLDVNGYITVRGSTACLYLRDRLDDGAVPWIPYNSGGKLRFYYGGDKLVFDSSGCVGIGTDSPHQSLHVYGNKYLGVGDESAGVVIRKWEAGAEILGIDTTLCSAWNALGIRSGAGTQLHLATDGNVGIGTTSPSEKLHVAGKGRIEAGLVVGNGAASGFWSVAEGTNTVASGMFSHAEGYGSVATGDYASDRGAHAEGFMTTAYGEGAHSEGFYSSASIRSHAEGLGTYAYGYGSHAEGETTVANGALAAHAEGSHTTASGWVTHAAGCRAQATHDRSFVWSSDEDNDFASTDTAQFSVNALNGIRLLSRTNAVCLLKGQWKIAAQGDLGMGCYTNGWSEGL